MPVQQVERKLAAILAADVVGYSRLMGQDEADTLARLKEHRRELIDPKVGEHKGRIVKTTGDGILIEFPSVVEAVSCAVAVQRGMADRNVATPESDRIVFRVGINLGDIIIDEDDIFGDGVNVAARLESLAAPGGICVSRMVRDQVRDRLPFSFEDLGEQTVKNIARPIRAFAVNVNGAPAVPPLANSIRSTGTRHAIIVAASLFVVLCAGLGAWLIWSRSVPAPIAAQAPTGGRVPSSGVPIVATQAPRLSIVVLPLNNLSKDPEQEYFADGVSDDLTTDLTRITDSFVIAHNTALTYKGKAVDVKQIGKELGVRYALEGSVRRTGQRVEVNVQLIDTESGAHVWANRFDADRADLEKAQDDIVARLAVALRLEILEAAGRRIEREQPVNPDASDFVMRGWVWYYRPVSTQNLLEAQTAFERALELDPQSVNAKIGLATVLTEFVVNVRQHVVNDTTISPAQDIARADQLLTEVMAHGTESARAYFAIGRLRRIQGRLIESRMELTKGLALDRNNQGVVLQLGITTMMLGQPEAALPYFDKAIKINGGHANEFYFTYWMGQCYLLLGRNDESIESLREAHTAKPEMAGASLLLAAALGLQGDLEAAKAALSDALKLKPKWNTMAQLSAGIGAVFWAPSPEFVALRKKTIDVGLIRAGLREE